MAGLTKKQKKAEKNAKKREFILRHFRLHQHSSWSAIAEMICNESGRRLPGTRSECRRISLNYQIVNPSVRDRKPASRYKDSDAFYSSTAWRELRYIALKQSGGCCTLCGAKASDGVSIHVDHITPRSIDPSQELDLNNLQILCQDCNIGKSNRDAIDWRY